MWWTDGGERVLEGAEGALFAEVLLDLIDGINLSEDDDYYLGVHVFDRLTYGQKVSVLSTIGNGLLRKDVPIVELSAVLEGAIAAVFAHLKNCGVNGRVKYHHYGRVQNQPVIFSFI